MFWSMSRRSPETRARAGERRRCGTRTGTFVAGAILLATGPGDPRAGSARTKRPRALPVVPESIGLSTGFRAVPADIGQSGRAWWIVESGPVRFGEIVPGETRDLTSAVRVRVFAATDWTLKLVAESPLRVLDRGGALVPSSRLQWRGAGSGGFRPFPDNGTVVVARGSATRESGTLVTVDLRLDLADTDDLGQYGCSLRVAMDTF